MPDTGNLEHADDLRLVELCNHGTAAEAEAAFATLYHRHKDYVMRLAMRYTGGDRDLSLDVLQETFGYLLRKFPGVASPSGDGGLSEGDGVAGKPFVLTAKLTTFLFPVVKHNAMAAKRKARRYTPPAEDAPEPVAPAEHQADHEPDDVAAVLSGLSDERQEVLMLRFVDGLSLAEIAEAMGIPVGTVKSRIHLAIKQLRGDPRVREFFEV